MTDLRREFEENVEKAREALYDAERELRWLDGRPPSCKCDPRDWGDVPGPVCDRFEPDPDPHFAEYCHRCQHPAECHEVKP